jgi:hypothetical protein
LSAGRAATMLPPGIDLPPTRTQGATGRIDRFMHSPIETLRPLHCPPALARAEPGRPARFSANATTPVEHLAERWRHTTVVNA